MAFNYEMEKLHSKYSMQLRVDTDVFLVKLRYDGASAQNIFGELLTTLDQLTASLGLEHPDLIAKSIDVPLQRPKNLTGQLVFTQSGSKSTHATFRWENAIDCHCGKRRWRKWSA